MVYKHINIPLGEINYKIIVFFLFPRTGNASKARRLVLPLDTMPRRKVGNGRVLMGKKYSVVS